MPYCENNTIEPHYIDIMHNSKYNLWTLNLNSRYKTQWTKTFCNSINKTYQENVDGEKGQFEEKTH